MKNIINVYLVILLVVCLLLSGCSQETSEINPNLPTYSQELLAQFWTPMDKALHRVGWKESQLTDLTGGWHYLLDESIEFLDSEFSVIIYGAPMPSEESEIRKTADLPIDNSDTKYLEEIYYDAYFKGEDAREDAISLMEEVVKRYTEEYGDPNSGVFKDGDPVPYEEAVPQNGYLYNELMKGGDKSCANYWDVTPANAPEGVYVRAIVSYSKAGDYAALKMDPDAYLVRIYYKTVYTQYGWDY